MCRTPPTSPVTGGGSTVALVKAYTAKQVRAAEAPLLAAGVPLMERAAHALAEQIALLLPGERTGTVTLLVGAGNNGGDALFAGAELAAKGVEVTIVQVADRLHEEAKTAAIEAGARVLPTGTDAVTVASAAQTADVLADAILGTGTSADPALRGRARAIVVEIIRAVEHGGRRPSIVAVDVPSGIDPTDGRVPDPAVLAADVTVTFGGCKTGLLLAPAAAYAGRIMVADIGLGDELERVTRRGSDRHGGRRRIDTPSPGGARSSPDVDRPPAHSS